MNNVIELNSFNYVPLQNNLKREVVINKMCGSHFLGAFDSVKLEELHEKFGSPMLYSDEEGDYKVKYQWCIEFEDGLIATIYDWKVDYSKVSVHDQQMTWHIGGHDSRVMDRIYKIVNLDEKMTYHEAIVTIEKAFLTMKSRDVKFNYDRLNIAWSKIQRGV